MKEQRKDIFVNKNLTLEQLQREFKVCFPYLSIEFYKNGIEYSNNQRLLTLEKISTSKEMTSFVIIGQMTVDEVEAIFENNMGIKIGIFRKLGTSSVETSYTSKWTLERQNKIGSEEYFEHE